MKRNLDADEIWGLIDYHGREIQDICGWISEGQSIGRRAVGKCRGKMAELEKHLAAVSSLERQAREEGIQL